MVQDRILQSRKLKFLIN